MSVYAKLYFTRAAVSYPDNHYPPPVTGSVRKVALKDFHSLSYLHEPAAKFNHQKCLAELGRLNLPR